MFIRRDASLMCEVLFKRMGFGGVLLQQESVAAAYGMKATSQCRNSPASHDDDDSDDNDNDNADDGRFNGRFV